ncbi:MAG: hypothetical protein ACTSYL_12235 [Candidatus Thorarchaeota archaeon]
MTSTMFVNNWQETSQPMTNRPTLDNKMIRSETNLSRVSWQSNHIANGDMEMWNDPHMPSDFFATTTKGRFAWYATSPDPVNEGSRSLGMQASTNDPERSSDLVVTQTGWPYWDNPINTTLKFDYYVAQNPAPDDGDAFYIEVRMASTWTKTLWYYLSGSPVVVNSSINTRFIINDGTDSWKTFDHNLTRDFMEAFNETPTQFRLINIHLDSETADYLRVFIDDMNLLNDTDVKLGGSINHGDFEATGTGYQWTWTSYNAADIVQSSTTHEGDWSTNMTAATTGYESYARLRTNIDKRLTILNPGRFTFYWQLGDVQHLSDHVYAYVRAECHNGTDEEFNVYYMLSYGEAMPAIGSPGDLFINATGFNTTGTWNFFNRSVFEDIRAVNSTNDIYVERIHIEVYAHDSQGRISVLFDEMAFVSASLNDMSYEDQGEVGSEVISWDNCKVGTTPNITVTDDAKTGSKAANLTLSNEEDVSTYQTIRNIPINNQTELYFDLNWKLISFSGLTDEYIMVGVYTEHLGGIGYVLANGSPVESSGNYDKYIVVPEVNTTGTWFNLQRDLYRDFSTVFNTTVNDTIVGISLAANTETNGNLTILFDDVYLYTDPAPELSGLAYSPHAPTEEDNVAVAVSAEDPSLSLVMLHYRVNNGSWALVQMSVTADNRYNATIAAQAEGATVEFYVTANDTYGKTTTLLNGSEYYVYTVIAAQTTTTTTMTTSNTTTTTTTPSTSNTTTSQPAPPDITPLLILLGIILAVVVVGVMYVVFVKPRQQTS